MKRLPLIELLEARIAPAAVFSYTDVDGDKVTFHSNKGTSVDLGNIVMHHAVAQGSGFRIDSLDFTYVPIASMGEFSGAQISVSVVRGPHGDGHVDLGSITTGLMPLGSFIAPNASIQQINCGDGTHGIGQLVIGSYGTAAPGYFNNGISDTLGIIDGSVGSIHIRGDIAYGALGIENPLLSMSPPVLTVGSIFIGGNLNGAVAGATMYDGELIVAAKSTGSIVVKGSVIGGAISQGTNGEGSGVLFVSDEGGIHSITVGGNIIGGSGELSGLVEASAVSATVGGSVIGGTSDGAGLLQVSGKRVAVMGSVIGGVTAAVPGIPAGAVQLGFGAESFYLGGSLIAGGITGTTDTVNGSISSDGNVGTIHIAGSVIGTNANRALILIQGFHLGLPTKNFNSIGSITIGGSIEYGIIASGHSADVTTTLGNATLPEAGIGRVTIDGDFYHSSIMAGTNDEDVIGVGRIIAGGANPDTQSSTAAGTIAILGPVVIKGALLDDYNGGGDSGFEAAEIVSITVGGETIFHHGQGLTFFDPNDFVFADEITPT